MQAIEPHWSPDGSQIAFLGLQPDSSERIYLIPESGGTPRLAADGHSSEGVPTWSPDGASLVFGDLYVGDPRSMSIHRVDIRNQRVTTLPGSASLWNSRWSSDGQFISALTADSKRLKLYDSRRKKWEDVLCFDRIDYTSGARIPGFSSFGQRSVKKAEEWEIPRALCTGST